MNPSRTLTAALRLSARSSNLPRATLTRSIKHSAFLSSFLTDESPKMVGPMYSRIEEKLTAGLEPATLVIIDESDKHKGHAAMRGVTRGETHFRVTAVSEKFQGKMPVARHKMIYEILSEELKDGGIHALSITAKTLAESSR